MASAQDATESADAHSGLRRDAMRPARLQTAMERCDPKAILHRDMQDRISRPAPAAVVLFSIQNNALKLLIIPHEGKITPDNNEKDKPQQEWLPVRNLKRYLS